MLDKTVITLVGGKGGDGATSFSRGSSGVLGRPDGGGGGAGGPVVLVANRAVETLGHLMGVKSIQGSAGGRGGRSDKTGRTGKVRELRVPLGTVVWVRTNSHDWEPVADLENEGDWVTGAKGGPGGRGNRSFAGPRNRVPMLAEAGGEGEAIEAQLELEIPCDFVLVGPPNGGKSALLGGISAAAPRIAAYPFTTLEPELGVVEWKGRALTVVGLPALVAGSHEGKGLGAGFLRHAARAKAVVYLLDGESSDLVSQYKILEGELAHQPGALTEKAKVVAVNKADLPEAQAQFKKERAQLLVAAGTEPQAISASEGLGVTALLDTVAGLVPESLNERPRVARRPRDLSALVVKEVDSEVSVQKRPDGFEVACSRAERIARGSDLSNWRARMQFHRVLGSLGVLKALEAQGVRSGDTVRIGPVELEWR